MADDPGASKGERDNAKSLLARMPDDNGRREDYHPPTGDDARPAGSPVAFRTLSPAEAEEWFRYLDRMFERARGVFD